MVYIYRLPLIFLIFLQFIAVASHAQEVQLPHILVGLKAESGEVRPGDVAVLALDLKPEEGWHVYWKNPGDSGAAPKFRWDIQSAALKLSATHWPLPQRFYTKHLVNYGYGQQAALLFDFQVSDKARLGSELIVDLESELLVCKDECIPVQGQFRQTFKVVERFESDLLDDSAEFFQRARSRLPQLAAPGLVKVQVGEEQAIFDLSAAQALEAIDLFPSQRGVFSNVAPVKISPKSLALERLKGRELPNILEGVLVVSAQGRQEAYDLAVPLVMPEVMPGVEPVVEPVDVAAKAVIPTTTTTSAMSSTSAVPTEAGTTVPVAAVAGLLGAIIFAFLGGIVLNLMPCVLPVLGLKLFEIVEGRTHGGRGMRRDALAYSAGVILSMLILAAILLVFRGSAEQLGWGFQLQTPLFVAIMALIIFALGLSFVGLMEVPTPAFVSRVKITGPFSSGILATLLATPCTAPFMGTALAYALTSTVFESILVFTTLGLGVATPYLMVAFIPSLAKMLPRPGAWMILVKELLAFPLFATTLWLLWVLGNQRDIFSVVAVASGCLLVAFAGWILNRAKMSVNRGFKRGARMVAGVVAVAAIVVSIAPIWTGASSAQSVATESRESSADATPVWTPFSQHRLNEFIDSGRPVFVDFTAEWCITCKVNEKFVLSNSGVNQAFKERDFVMVKADWTDGNPEIGLALKRLDRQGVPVYVVYRKRGDKVAQRVLPTLLTPGILREAIAEFGN